MLFFASDLLSRVPVWPVLDPGVLAGSDGEGTAVGLADFLSRQFGAPAAAAAQVSHLLLNGTRPAPATSDREPQNHQGSSANDQPVP